MNFIKIAEPRPDEETRIISNVDCLLDDFEHLCEPKTKRDDISMVDILKEFHNAPQSDCICVSYSPEGMIGFTLDRVTLDGVYIYTFAFVAS